MSEKIYCGNARIVTTKYGELMKVSFSKDDINKMVTHMRGTKSDWINLVVKEKKEKVEGKPTHYLEVDEWKPKPEQESKPEPETGLPPSALGGEIGEDEDLPF